MHIERSITAGIEHRRLRNALLVGAGLVMTAAPVVAGMAAAGAGTSSERFSLMDDSTSTTQSGTTFSAIATGSFADGGTATKTGSLLTLHLSKGSITLAVKSTHRSVNKGADCVQTQSSSGAYTITGGTGSYSGISGSGTAAIDGTFVQSDSGGSCASSQLAAQSTVAAAGPVSLK
jgi:hypothetical protein